MATGGQDGALGAVDPSNVGTLSQEVQYAGGCKVSYQDAVIR